MRIQDGQTLFSASDLVAFLGCAHRTRLDILDREQHLERAQDDESARLVKRKGLEHELRYLEVLSDQGLRVVEVPQNRSVREAAAHTREILAQGPDVVYQAVLLDGSWHGYADFLVRVPEPSALGDFSYEVQDTKLSRSSKASHALQIACYSEWLSGFLGRLPRHMGLVLGDDTRQQLRVAEFVHYACTAMARFEAFVATPGQLATPEPCAACDTCPWRERCAEEWLSVDHLSQVADLRRSQRKKLVGAGVTTMTALAELPENAKVSRLAPETLSRLRQQARLQQHKQRTGEDRFELLPVEADRGFCRLPRPDEGDLFFDMEGDPHLEGGLEYLFGVYHIEAGVPRFSPVWAHDRTQEKAALEAVIDLFTDKLARFPKAHIYHYNAYETAALKRLCSRYGTREAALDDLLRQKRFVDLYRVVREGLRCSEPSYSLKNLETFYMEKRSGEVKTAGDSIVVYERWIETGDDAALREIASYNEADCRSTMLLRDFLLRERPKEATWLEAPALDIDAVKARQETLSATEALRARLVDGCDESERSWRELLGDLLDFHKREKKPVYWAMFDRQGRSTEELIDDLDCLGGLVLSDSPPVPHKRSLLFTAHFPVQETKVKIGDSLRIAATLAQAGEIHALDLERGTVVLRRGPTLLETPLPRELSLIPGNPLKTTVLEDALQRIALGVAEGRHEHLAARALLSRSLPRVTGRNIGAPLARAGAELLPQIVETVCGLEHSALAIQGPPGTGKTFTAAHVIVELLARGKKVGVSSNSHKAIHTLLHKVEETARARGVRFRGVKKSSTDEGSFEGLGYIDNVTSNVEVSPTYDLIAGTAFLLARPELEDVLDVLFVDEAGQVSLANTVAMSQCARSLVLIGDQMQLEQPTQGTHPGTSGLSTLDHLLAGEAVVPNDRGIFLSTTYRLHPLIADFISAAVYEGQLHAAPGNDAETLVLDSSAHPDLHPAGLRFVGLDHEGCVQTSEEEAATLRELYDSLLEQRYVDRGGAVKPITVNDILVLSPYNAQVNLLKERLPKGARVGTVDKFQGQEAEVVLVSLATSSAEELPRGIEFLLSKNRLNVALSRARCLGMLIASRKLQEAPCTKVEQMKLVDLMCWVGEWKPEYLSASKQGRHGR